MHISTALPVLLAPAGSLRAVHAALDAGADAVYVGLEGWSRGGARSELSWDELAASQAAVAAAGKRLHLALNTIPKSRERRRLLDSIRAILDIGIDRVIVNDIGILASIRDRFPEVRLTASVGCAARTAEDVALLRDIGAHSVVVPGTLTTDEVAELKTVKGAAIEVMAHMVDEFILLGRCSMPSYVHMKPSAFTSCGPDDAVRQTGSVKRGGVGVCFRICEQAWDVFDGDARVDTRLFPSRQVSGIADLAAWVAAGVDVIKLQGRSLPVDLLAPLIARYRQAIDAPTMPPPYLPTLPPAWAVVGR